MRYLIDAIESVEKTLSPWGERDIIFHPSEFCFAYNLDSFT